MSRRNRRACSRSAVPVLLLAAVVLAANAGTALAEDGWTIRIEPTFMEAYGHDQHVLNIVTSAEGSDSVSAVKLDTESSVAWHSELQYTRGTWTVGWDFLWYVTSQKTPVLGSAANGESTIAFEIPDRRYLSTAPDRSVYFRTLEDTDLAMWTFDLYGMRSLGDSDGDGLSLQFGVRFADFDNDYHAAVGLDGVSGTRIDASSNYGRMTGPLLGVASNLTSGRHSFQGYVGQSVVFGSADLTSSLNDFNGSFSEAPEIVNVSSFSRRNHDVAIPITELRLKWTYQLTRHIGVGVGANTSVWWDVPVPPGTVPSGSSQALQENTVILLGVLGALEVTF